MFFIANTQGMHGGVSFIAAHIGTGLLFLGLASLSTTDVEPED